MARGISIGSSKCVYVNVPELNHASATKSTKSNRPSPERSEYGITTRCWWDRHLAVRKVSKDFREEGEGW